MNKKRIVLLLSLALSITVISSCGKPEADDSSSAIVTSSASTSSEREVSEISSVQVSSAVLSNKASSVQAMSSAKTSSKVPAISSSKTPIVSKAPTVSQSADGNVIINLDKYFNKDGFSYDKNRGDGDFDENKRDGEGAACYPADGFNGNVTYQGVKYKFGPLADGQKQISKCNGQKVDLQAPVQCKYIGMLAAAANYTGFGVDVSFKVNYTDGTSTTSPLYIVNWCFQWDDTVKIFPHRHLYSPDSKKWGDDVYKPRFFFYKLNVDAGKTVSSITFTDNSAINVFALTAVTK